MKLRSSLSAAKLHPLFAAFSLACFAFLAWQVATRQPITTFDFNQSIRIYQLSQDNRWLWDFAAFITDLGAGRPRTIVVVAVALVLILDRQWRLAIIWIFSQWVFQQLVSFTKDQFERPRPDFETTPMITGGWAFPSGHSAGAMVTYGMLAFILAKQWPGRRFLWGLVGLLGIIILMVGMSRMLLGVHWFTDVIGGYLLGLAYVSTWMAVAETFRARGD